MPLQKARELDATLAIVQAQFQKASIDLDGSKVAVKLAEDKWKATVDDRNARLQEQQTLQRDRERLKAFAPFVADSSRWLDRIDAALVSAQQVHAARQKAKSLVQELAELDKQVKSTEETRVPLQAAFESATTALSVAFEANKQFDVDQIASDRARLESSKSVLTSLFLQLRNAQTLRERIRSEQESLEQLQAAQGFDATAIEQIQTVELPQAERAIDVAKTQLEFIQAAVDDHAKRLRLTLQDGKECPVCGSIHHPYSQHEPDLEATAVKAAKKSVKDFEKKRDEVSNRQSRLRGSMETRLQQIELKTQELGSLRAEVVDIAFESHEHPEVAAVLAIEEDARLAVMESRLLEINRDLRTVESKEQKARIAAKHEVDCREIVERSAAELKKLNDRMTALLAQRGILNETVSNSQLAVQTADELRVESESRLQDLWSGLPTARQEYDSDAVAFRKAFERSATECGDIEKRIAETTNLIHQADAAIRPLEESLAETRKLAIAYEAVFQDITKDRAARLKEREQIFDGRPADDVEKEFKDRISAAAESLEAATSSLTEVDRLLVAAKSEFETKSQAAEVSQSELAAARSAREGWLISFISRTSKELTLTDLDEVLARDDAWIQSERESLKQLDEHVKAAEGACQVHANQLQQHLQTQPTQDEEQVVLASLQASNEEVAQAKSRLSGAQAVILNDNSRREQNLQLTERIQQQDAKADPWRRLNDLIGSADGAKFRMIAQRRTLDLLLRYANHQLNHLAVRYRLERLPESLNLIVIDRDMGDERRSIHSLSGGESFLVSLALALGLASLTSNRLRIESLFIDEGFGSLDPETLNTAMSALMHLEAQGRKVGVISHVTEMTDAIPVQIKVVKGRGGASRIVVPGALQETVLDVSPAAKTNSTTETSTNESVSEIATRLLAILQRELAQGKEKVSSKSLRDELGCDQKNFKAAQALLSTQVVTDGRSLRLGGGP
jgi:exonuclease SbcC